MPDWLKTTFAAEQALSFQDILIKQIVALLMGVIVALVFRYTRNPSAKDAKSMMTTLVLLTLLISMISSVIGDNVARAFSLVGALSIVRFRTVVEDTRDTAYVILAVGVGMAIGAGHFMIPALLIPMAAVASLIFRNRNPGETIRCEVIVRKSPGVDPVEVENALKSVGTVSGPDSLSDTRQGALIEATYGIRIRDASQIREIHRVLSAITGMASVEVKRLVKPDY